MNKFDIDGILVVEGKTDKAKLSSFISSPIFITNGFDVKESIVNFLVNVSKIHKIYLFLDNDPSGQKICEKIKNKVQNSYILKLAAKKYDHKFKKGNAEISIIELRDFFLKYKIDNQIFSKDISPTFLSYLSLKDKGAINQIVDKFSLMKGSNKYLSEQLNALGILKEDILQLIS